MSKPITPILLGAASQLMNGADREPRFVRVILGMDAYKQFLAEASREMRFGFYAGHSWHGLHVYQSHQLPPEKILMEILA